MNFAIIPWDENGLGDRMFDIKDKTLNVDHRLEQYYYMKKEFELKGDILHTIDFYVDLKQVDYFLFFELDIYWLKNLVDLHLEERMVYCNAEPPTVNKYNCKEGFKKLQKYFPYIMTWNDELVDEITVFKRNIPYYFEDKRENTPFENRKLLTCISGNKKSNHSNELYTERERVITFFEKNHPDKFDFYGGGWNKEKHPCYGGKIEDKSQIYHKYKFAIAFENMGNVKGYISEKILDCLTSGIVPIYEGAENIKKYIPEKCYISYCEFSSLNELANYLITMSEKEFNQYLEAADCFIHSEQIDLFSGQVYARYIYNVTVHATKTFRVSKINKLSLDFLVCVKNSKNKIKKGIHFLENMRK
ncbi:glycosyltransferase family 10 domain-containing protein [Eisenbergiella tayi]|uniref:Glycosyltransferase family 10 (Fucosyltransferase) n=1 Tax=Eisenbergiella tayi TaxID=1432052 RepID=A0A1E3AA18_9FIRM|nr:glycosyltransferase family 10 [Eisenbergiella tayi]ODM05614.1 Glycosyltransferase family 10 (fucosyltransferase) [Eisenbergiella tayi]